MGQSKTKIAPKTGFGKDLDLIATAAMAIDDIGNVLIDKNEILGWVDGRLERAMEIQEAYGEADLDTHQAAEGLDKSSIVIGGIADKLNSHYQVEGDFLDHVSLCQDHLRDIAKRYDGEDRALIQKMQDELTEGRRLLVRFSGQMLDIRDNMRETESRFIQAMNLLSEDEFEKICNKLAKEKDYQDKSPEELSEVAANIQADQISALVEDVDSLIQDPIDRAYNIADEIGNWFDSSDTTLNLADKYLHQTVNKHKMSPAIQYRFDTMPEAYKKTETKKAPQSYEEMKRKPKGCTLH